MARLSVTWGNPRLSVSYPAVLAGLSKLLGGDLSATGELTPELRQDHLFAGEVAVTGGLAAFLSSAAFVLEADLAATGGFSPDLQQDHLLGHALDASAALSADLQQEHGLGTLTVGTSILFDADLFVGHELAVDLAASGALAGGLEVTQEIGADLAATGGLTADLDVQAGASDPAFSAVAVAYTGTGATQSITGVGFEPEAVLILENGGAAGAERVITGASWSSNHWRLGISNTPAFWSDGVTSFDADGFSLGVNSSINGSGTDYVAICFAPGSGAETANFDELVSAVTFSAKTVSHALGTTPFWIWNLRNSSAAGVEWLTDSGVDHHSVNVGDTIVSAASTVTAVSASDVDIGTQSNWNGGFSGDNYMVFFGGAGSSGKYATGTYTGDGSSGNAITGLGFAPSVVMIRSVDGDGASVLVDELSSNTAFDLRDGNRDSAFTLDADGFTVNGNDKINRSGETFRYFAWV